MLVAVLCLVRSSSFTFSSNFGVVRTDCVRFCGC